MSYTLAPNKRKMIQTAEQRDWQSKGLHKPAEAMTDPSVIASNFP